MFKKALFFLVTFSSLVFALNIPTLHGRVNDYAKILTAEQATAIEGLLAQYEQQTSNQFAVLTVDSLEEDSLENFSMRTMEKWRLGQKGKDNGALLLIVKNERKVRIEVGYGLEPVLTDVFCGNTIRDVLAPAFRDGNYGQGIADTLYAMMQKTGAEFTNYNPQYTAQPETEIPNIVVIFFTVLIILLAIKNPLLAAYIISSLLSGGGRSSSSSYGGFSGGGGRFGGGGASGSW